MSAASEVLTPEMNARISALVGAEVRELRPMPGGHSGITLIADLDDERRVVVKVAAPGRPAVGRHDVLRQARAMRLAGAHVPAPEVIAEEDTDQPIAVVSFARGEAVEPAIDETGADLPADLVQRRFDAATDLLAQLHRVPLDDLQDEPVRTPAAELDQFRRISAAGAEEFRDLGEQAGSLLAQSVPSPGPVSLVHGDYRLGNLLMIDDTPQALVDWEIWTVGDPRVDLGWLAMFADTSHFPGIAREDVTVPGVDRVVARYEQATGAPVADANWFLRLGAFRMGAMMAHNLHRHRTGRHVDPYQESLPPTIRRLLTLSLDSA